MSNYQSPVRVVNRVHIIPNAPRLRRNNIVTAADLFWLVELIRRTRTMYIPPAPAPRPELVPGLCAEIEGGDCCVCLEDVGRTCVRRFGCGHETCMSCYTHIYGTTARCPLCRAEIKQVMRAPEKKIIRVHKKKWCCICMYFVFVIVIVFCNNFN